MIEGICREHLRQISPKSYKWRKWNVFKIRTCIWRLLVISIICIYLSVLTLYVFSQFENAYLARHEVVKVFADKLQQRLAIQVHRCIAQEPQESHSGYESFQNKTFWHGFPSFSHWLHKLLKKLLESSPVTGILASFWIASILKQVGLPFLSANIDRC